MGTNISIEGVSAGYGRNRVLRGIDWNIGPGVTGLLGPNGSGKTTLLSVMVGLLRPAEGIVKVQGSMAEPRFGLVPQRFTLPGDMRLADAISYAAWINGADERDPAVQRALAAVDLIDKTDVRVKTLSGGQRQRAGIAAGLAHQPDVLVLDEPTVGLDAEQRWRLRDVIAEIGRSHTVVVSTHLLEDVSYLCQRVGVLAHGRLVFDGTVTELEAPDDSRTDVRRSPIEAGYARLLTRSEEAA